MHEMSIVSNILDIIRQEMEKHGCTTLRKVRIKHGRLANVVPEAMDFAWKALTTETEFESAEFESVEVPVVLRCHACGTEFTPENQKFVLAPCPECDEDLGHEVVSGRELFIEHMEAD